jgi:hypothetical protein
VPHRVAPHRVVEVKDDVSSASSLSLTTRVEMSSCPKCLKDILAGSPSCFHCGATLEVLVAEALLPGDQAVLAQIHNAMALERTL